MRSAQNSLKAKVSRTCHTRRTRRTPQLNSSAQPWRLPASRLPFKREALKATSKHRSDRSIHKKKKGLQGMVEYDTFGAVNRRVGPREGRILPSFT